jgi:hypothetical protein
LVADVAGVKLESKEKDYYEKDYFDVEYRLCSSLAGAGFRLRVNRT